MGGAASSNPNQSKTGHAMVEAENSLQQIQFRARMGREVVTEARRRAIKATKRELQAQGHKFQHMSRRDIVLAAEEYLAKHPELIAETKEIIERWKAEGVFGPRGGISRTPRGTPFTVQMSCAKWGDK